MEAPPSTTFLRPSTPTQTAALSPAVSPKTTVFPQNTSTTSQNSSSPDEITGKSSSDAFTGEDLDPNNTIPTIEEISLLDDYQVFDKDGKAVAFGNLYKGENVARRILLVFVRHFFCGNCQEYLRTLTSSISPAALLSLPHPTFIAIIGCGSPSLIPMYTAATSCPYPIYADPSKGLYRALNMGRTLDLGKRPEYQRRSTIRGMLESVGQSLKMVKGGKIFKGGDYQQVGGEFLFEPVDWDAMSPGSGMDIEKQLGHGRDNGEGEQRSKAHQAGERKHVTWCHRMRNTRDHVELPELREVLGLEIEGKERDGKRWERALAERKGTGMSGRESYLGGLANKGPVDADLEKKLEMLGRKQSVRSRASSEKLMGTPSPGDGEAPVGGSS